MYINTCVGQQLQKFGHTSKRYNLHATIPTVKPAHPKNHCWSGIGKMIHLPKEMNAVSTKGEALNTSFVRRWFLLSSCTSLAALHSSARNHATQFSMFLCSSKNKKQQKKTFCYLLLSIFWGSCFVQLKRWYLIVDLFCTKCRTTHRHTMRHCGKRRYLTVDLSCRKCRLPTGIPLGIAGNAGI